MSDFFQISKVYPWQAQAWNNLTTRFPNIAHGLLFFGKRGAGKSDFTWHFVAWVLCTNKQVERACGECSSCTWLKSGTHPNFLHITTDEENKKSNAQIKIEKIRNLQPFVEQISEGWRVIVIEPADALNIAAANALLKTLEEPTERILIILLTEHCLKLPATIRSRVQRYPLDRVKYVDAVAYLNQKKISNIELSLNLANGMPLQAVDFQKSTWFEKRAVFLDDWFTLVSYKETPLKYATKWIKELSFAEFQILFEYLLLDIIAFKLNQHVKNLDLDFTKISECYTLEQLFDIHTQIQQMKKLSYQNIQTNLIFDKIFILLMNIS